MSPKKSGKCPTCGKTKPKNIPYGAKRVSVWCPTCDRDKVIVINKKRARREEKSGTIEEVISAIDTGRANVSKGGSNE